MNDLLMIILLTLLPFLELRASIPYGVLQTDISTSVVFIVAVVSNIVLAPLLYMFLDKFIHLFLKVKWIDRIYSKTVEKTQQKVHKYIEKYGVFGLALFIGVPLPGSGVYSGALGAYLLGYKFKDFFKAAMAGVLIAGIVVLVVSLAGNGLWGWILKV